ncbi:hypothetical protein NDU88_005266 [Pleurodeles waltl]|uniref:Uncharacterized protein n=1 Tax=Pleurodeles waltl TaxID=8319 RepID=A0AAV7MXJ0_PLEWA|nr:hypothetical protein NDU88_005266 [Pleurodeles waltl]
MGGGGVQPASEPYSAVPGLLFSPGPPDTRVSSGAAALLGRGRATKQDGRLERVLRAATIPERQRGREDSRTTYRIRSPSTPTTGATRNHARGPRRSEMQGRKLATRPRPIRPGKRGGVASSEDRRRRAPSGKEPAERAAGPGEP